MSKESNQNNLYEDKPLEEIYEVLIKKLKNRRNILLEKVEELQKEKENTYQEVIEVETELLKLGHIDADNILSTGEIAKKVNKGRKASKYEVEKALQNGNGIEQFKGVRNWRSVRRWRDKYNQKNNSSGE